MNFADTPQEAAFRQEVREFLRTELPPELKDIDGESGLFGRGPLMQEWRRRLAARGWIAPALAQGVRRRRHERPSSSSSSTRRWPKARVPRNPGGFGVDA
jgi:alkylation response protein AidB-like acyl-CoA dehydrogenase